ncbi:MAG: hypothetical protein IGS23_12865 [Rivularia sp. T60_A2020_040]|nr:hypothetical protein [Rivularia sp. T60_A2020_040]
MNKLFPKLGLFLIIVANATPVFAASKYQNTSLLNQQIAHQQSSQPIITAGIFKDVKKIIDTVDRVDRTADKIRVRKVKENERKIRFEMQQKERELIFQQRKAREEERVRIQAEYAAARRAATQKQLEEAARRRQYFNSLSPEQKEAYIKQQQQVKQKQMAAGLLLLGLMMSAGGNNSPQQAQEHYIIHDNSRPSSNPAPNPVTPIGGNSGFYGDCHHAGC